MLKRRSSELENAESPDQLASVELQSSVTTSAETASAGVVSPGTMLREARESQGLSVEEVAERLYLTKSKVQSLEQDDFKRMSEATFIRGYMRSYANLLGLSGDVVAQAFNQLHLVNRKVPVNPHYLGVVSGSEGLLVDVSVKQQAHWGDAKVRWFTYGVALLLGLMVVFNWEQIEYKGFMGMGFEKVAVESVDGSLIVEDLNSTESSLPPLHLLGGTLSDLLNEDPPPSQAEAKDYPQEMPQYERLVDNQGIFMSFSGECWVSIKDQDDQVIFASLKNAGETLDISGIGPFKVLLGNAPVVELKYNGRAVNLRPFTRKQTHTAVVRLHS
ncbi:MAG: hypothetical protein COB51_02690 [Moraxellaceae bacterium]|nr:MAG: hypothetical protein COB51_02690 [Moraxellaceae bacterium]